MQPGPSRQPGRGRRGEKRRTEPAAAVSGARSPEEAITRFNKIISVMQHREKQAGGRRAARKEDKEGRGSQGDAERGREKERGGGGRRAASEGGEGGEEMSRLRWRLTQLEKEKLELTSSHNQEACRLQVEVTRLRSSLERGEAQRAELQYQLAVSRRDAERVGELSREKEALSREKEALSREKEALTEREAELQQKVDELQKALLITRQAREEDQHALQQEVEERDRLIQSFSSENQRLHRLLQDQEEALEESERRMAELQREMQKEAEATGRQAEELKHLTESEERSRKEKELSDQRVKSLESSVEAERAAHLETKFHSELLQRRARDLEAVVAVERSGQQEAQRSLELLRAQFREVERAFSGEKERSDGAERALERLQSEYEHSRSDMSAALETQRKVTSDLRERLEEEKRQHAATRSLLQQAAQRQSDAEESFLSLIQQLRDALRQHGSSADSTQPAKDDGKPSPAEVLRLLTVTLSGYQHRLEDSDTQLQDLLSASEKLQEENRTLQQLTSDQRRQMDESRQASAKLEEEVAGLRQESSDWSMQTRHLQAELQKRREELQTQREELQTQREELQKQREEVQTITDCFKKESTARLSFLYCLYQRLLAGCVLLRQPQSILGNFTWKELCDVISEQVDQLTSDLRKANDKVVHLQRACEKKSACVRQLQRSQEGALTRLEESVRRREEAWSSQHTHTVSQLQIQLQSCRSQCDSLQDHASSLERRCSSLTSDLSRLQSLLSRSRRESSSFFLACALLAGTLRHAQRCVQALSQQKSLLSRWLAEKQLLEEEVRRLADALGGEKDTGEEEGGGRRAARRRWRRSVCVVLALKRWCALTRRTTVLFRLERGGSAAAVCVYGEATATQKGQEAQQLDEESPDGVCSRWLRSKRLSSVILSSMADLQGALSHTGSTPSNVISAARSGLSRLLDHLPDQSDSSILSGRADEDSLSSRLRLGLDRLTAPQPDTKTLVSSIQQHFLLFSKRLHSAEVERRSLRLEVANLKRGLQQEKEEMVVPAERFHSLCEELRQALSREQEAQSLFQDQSSQLHALQRRVAAQTAEQTDSQRSLSRVTQALTEARRDVSRKERSLRILGKHLSGVHRERRQVEERLQRAEDELRDAARRQDCVIRCMKAAETSCKQVRESLVQSQRSPAAQPRPLLLPLDHLQLSGAESMMGAPEVTACQSFLAVVSQLCHACSSRIDWLQEEVSAHRSHVTALRSELQDVCLRDNLAFVPVEEFPEASPFIDVEKSQPDPVFNLSNDPGVGTSPAPLYIDHAPSDSPRTNPAPPSALSKPIMATKKGKKTTKKNRGSVTSH
ncbi:coiled-coil domain-containing protein 171-like [Leuresthes tenuis]|uniref:coiled-coil domain-containing protein 171-like n=1 Tax=Leuresthes tenuis TaxID=355514 RepID=UPI003B507329